MTDARLPVRAAFAVVAALVFWAATNNGVYEATSPHWLSLHVVLRKLYSVAAFAVVGALFRAAFPRPAHGAVLRTACAIALYSGAIEVAQFLHGAQEGIGLNAFDVFCGAIGGGTGALLAPTRIGPVGLLKRGNLS